MKDALLGVNGIPCNRGDRLVIQTWLPSGLLAPAVQLRYLFAPNNGEPIYGFEEFTVAQTAVAQLNSFVLTDGILISCTLAAVDTALQNGELYAAVSILKGSASTKTNRIPLISGYVTGAGALNYPIDTSQAQNSGVPSSTTEVMVPNGAGLPITHQYPTNEMVQIILATVDFTTDATVATRQVFATLTNPNGIIWQANASISQAASLTRQYIATIGNQPTVARTGFGYIQLPPNYFDRTLTLTFTADNLQAADDFTAGQSLRLGYVGL